MIQRRLAATIFKCSPQRVRFDETRLADIKEAITKADVRGLIKEGIITRLPVHGNANTRKNVRAKQNAKGRRRGAGSRKGKANARMPEKQVWMARIRVQRALLNRLRDRQKIADDTFRDLYMKAKGGFFRSERHIKVYLEEQNLFTK
ncbi:MAG: 50S ribosomal protein L19e [Nanoarchaeota archaeon]